MVRKPKVGEMPSVRGHPETLSCPYCEIIFTSKNRQALGNLNHHIRNFHPGSECVKRPNAQVHSNPIESVIQPNGQMQVSSNSDEQDFQVFFNSIKSIVPEF